MWTSELPTSDFRASVTLDPVSMRTAVLFPSMVKVHEQVSLFAVRAVPPLSGDREFMVV